VKVAGRPQGPSFSFDHPDSNALMTLFTTRMLAHGFLASSSFNPTLAHEVRHVEAYLDAAARVFPELVEAMDRGDALRRIDGKVKHTTFARLVD
jgi:glutamate-1-semialdehyde 2,1-aminomutase